MNYEDFDKKLQSSKMKQPEVPMKKKPMVNRTIRFPREVLAEADRLGIDVSEFCRGYLEARVADLKFKERLKRGKR